MKKIHQPESKTIPRQVRITTAIFYALILVCASTAAFAAPPSPPSGKRSSQPIRLQQDPARGIAEPLEFYRSERPPPAAKPTLFFQSECSSEFVAALDGAALVAYLQSHPVDGCLNDYMWDFDAHLLEVFTDQNMQVVFAALEELAPTYDGTNQDGLEQLWFFPHVAYFYEFFEDAVVPFDAATQTAHIAASAAFAANPHIYDLNDEAARILGEWLTVTDHDGLRHLHLEQVKQVLLKMTPARAQSTEQREAYNNVFFILFRGLVNDDQDYLQAVRQDGEIIAVLQQAALYEYLYPDYSYLIENAIGELARLVELDTLQGEVVAALGELLPLYPRLSAPSLSVAKNLEDHADCLALDICREDLVDEIVAQVFPNHFVFDDGQLVFETALDSETVQIMYHAAKQVQAQLHRLIESTTPAPDDTSKTLFIKIYGTNQEYLQFQGYLFDLDTNNGGIYIEGDATFYTYQRTAQESTFTLEELFRHEYVHYLAGRFIQQGLWGQTPLYQDCRMVFFDEGLAEFLAASTQADGIPVRRVLVESIDRDGTDRLDVEQILNSCYSDGFKFYRYSSLLFNYLYQHRRTQLLEMIDLIRNSDVEGYDASLAALAADASLESSYQAFVDLQVAGVQDLVDPSTSFPLLTALQTDSAGPIETAYRAATGDTDADCGVIATQLNHRFGCAGQLAVPVSESGDRGALNTYLSAQLDERINASNAAATLNNFAAMNCYFADLIPGASTLASYYCDGPLRATNVSLDSDGDGVADGEDDFPKNYLAWTDGDGDGVLDPEEIPDTDMDGLPDGYEQVFGFDPLSAADADTDADGDGVDNLGEFLRRTDPRDASSTPPTVDLTTNLRNDSGTLMANDLSSLNLYVGLRFSGDQATNVQLHYTSSRPLNFERIEMSAANPSPCTAAELTQQSGLFSCGDLDNGTSGIDLFFFFTPLQSGELEFEVRFSADEIELTPADNSGQLTRLFIQPDPAAAAADFDGDGQVGFSDFFLLSDAFGGTDPLYDLDSDGLVGFADFFIFVDYFGWKAFVK